MAFELMARGASVIVADHDDVAAEDVVARARGQGHCAVAYSCDVRDPAEIGALFTAIARDAGRLDALVNNAGVFPRVTLQQTTTEALDDVVSVNFRGAVLCTTAAMPLLAPAKGMVVFIGSSAAEATTLDAGTAPYFQLYGASKAALERWALGTAPALAAVGVTAVVVRPGRPLLTDGVLAMDLPAEELSQYVDPAFVGVAIGWLLAQQPAAWTGRLLSARDFGSSWGDARA